MNSVICFLPGLTRGSVNLLSTTQDATAEESHCVSIKKRDGGLRPFGVGEIIYRLASKAILRHSFRPDWLLPFQFGVGTKGGVEPVTRAVQGALDWSLLHSPRLPRLHQRFQHGSRSDVARAVRQHAPTLYRASKWAYNQPYQVSKLRASGRSPQHRKSFRVILLVPCYSPLESANSWTAWQHCSVPIRLSSHISTTFTSWAGQTPWNESRASWRPPSLRFL